MDVGERGSSPPSRSRPAFPLAPHEVSAIATAKLPLRETLARYDIVPRKRLGQSFLHDPALGRRIVTAAGVGPGSEVLEIGPGLGALTIPLLESGARVTAIEIDRRIADCLQETIGERPGFTLIREDVLRIDLTEVAPSTGVLVANLPYSITGPLLARLIDHVDRIPRAVIMVQREVGNRLLAGAGGRGLGAPAVLLRLLYRVRRLFEVGRGAFYPPPDVVSAVLALDRIPGAALDSSLRQAVNIAYRHRRKMLRKTLKETVASEEVLAAALVALGRSDRARPEDLEPEDWPVLLERAGARSSPREKRS
jgi:16S rRNA (adenine1518-N6/adenine1519-N6)-dimethyltransferase